MTGTALAAAAVATAGMAFAGPFGWPDLVPVVGVATSVPVVLSTLVSRVCRAPVWLSLALTAACWQLVALETLFRGEVADVFLPGSGAIGTVLHSLAGSWRLVVTTVPPLAGRPELLVLVHALVWAAAFAGTELALRTRWPLGPALPALGVLVAALLVAGGTSSPVLPAAALVGWCGALALVRGDVRLPSSRLLAGFPIVVCIAVLAGTLGPFLPFSRARPPYDPRQHLPVPPPSALESVSPLDQASAWLLTPDIPLFTVQATVAENWRLVVLDRYDGTTWSSSAAFSAAGSRLPGLQVQAGASMVTQRVTIDGLDGVWLPAADRPSTFLGGAVAADPASGVLISPQPVHRGMRYEVISAVHRDTEADFAKATPADDRTARADLVMPAVAADVPGTSPIDLMRRIAEQATAGSRFPFQQALQLANYLRSNEVYDAVAPPGHSLRSIEYFLITSHVGTSEQFAAAYALMARTLGLPSRLAVGFRPGVARSGVWHVRAGDVLVWPELDFRELGWTPFYPTPDQERGPGDATTVPAGESAARHAIDEEIAVAVPASATGRARPGKPEITAHRGVTAWQARWPALLAAVLGVPGLAYLLLVTTVPALRRRARRGRAGPGERVIGAWHETVDGLRLLGLLSTTAMCAREVADMGIAALGSDAEPHLRPLAEAVNQALFAAEPPSETAARAAWHHSDALRRLASRAMPWPAALRHRLDPRSAIR